ncbi:mitochondrial enoyl reductase, putative [Paecilomyces variotii No. 5]|uniref:enoyl-[acyl-carrier-protein] reductase n=1 Tax=Byssochlamys spectabilis (strain No. 5 / NBRC 109023) TaxID=1356009 RepID=V5G1A6_BYSSN|nr:mitochondrial enoyl reductase, putative [Paecilomyces variotii No. 5]
MFSRGALRTAANRVRSVPAAPFLGSPLTRTCLEPTRRAVAGQSIEARRFVSAYGYQQAKALVYSQYGEPKDVLKLHKHSIAPPHGSQVTLRLLTAPLNPADINQIQGVYPSKPPFDSTLGTGEPSAVAGNEGAFEVIATGSDVKNLKKGDWVIMKRTGQGTWRTHAQMEESKLIKVDKEGLTPLQVGTVSVNPVTAYRMIKDFCNWDWLRAGEEWLIQNGANSGVGRAAIQLAREWGIKTLNVVRDRPTPEETEALKKDLYELGATAVVSESELLSGGSFKEYVNELTRKGKEPIRLGLNCVGGKNATALAKTLAPGSQLVTYGAMSKQPVALPSGLLIFKDLVFSGFWVSKWGDKHPELKEDTINDVLRLTRAGKFKDIPVQEVKWTFDKGETELAEEVNGTLGGFRSGKGVFVYEE